MAQPPPVVWLVEERLVEVAVEGIQPAIGKTAGQSPADSCNHRPHTRHVWPKMGLIKSGDEVAYIRRVCNYYNYCRAWGAAGALDIRARQGGGGG